MAIKAIENTVKASKGDLRVVIYTGDDEPGDEILKKALDRFNIKLEIDITFLKLKNRYLIDPRTWPFFTLAGQALGSILLANECLNILTPDIFIDTLGLGFTYPWVRFMTDDTYIVSYTHYPFIQNDMLSRVNVVYKAYYYKALIWLYKRVGQWADLIMANSRWTQNHLVNLFEVPDKTLVVYPPCDVTEFKELPFERQQPRFNQIVSVSQFRPEKDQLLQVRALEHLKKEGKLPRDAKLVMIGGVRNADDERILSNLEQKVKDWGLENHVEFRTNVRFDEILSAFSESKVGIHTMLDEHFGIGVVEMMAAGLITIAHNSGGPKSDIIGAADCAGFLATTAEEYAEAIHKGLTEFDSHFMTSLRRNGQEQSTIFSNENFMDQFSRSMESFINAVKA